METILAQVFLCLIMGVVFGSLAYAILSSRSNTMKLGPLLLIGIIGAILCWPVFSIVTSKVSLPDVYSWLFMGLVSGLLASLFYSTSREKIGYLAMISLGLIGALLGGALFHYFGIDLDLKPIKLDAEDLVASFVGASILLGGVVWLRNLRIIG